MPADTVTKPLRIAVVGAGLIGQQHIARIAREPQAKLAAIVDPAASAKALADSLGVPWAAELDSVLAGSNRPDAAVIATPNQLHVAGALACVTAGVPVLLEKPVADDVASAMQLVDAAEAAGVPILIGHHRRHSAHIREAKRIIESGQLGRITAVNALCWFLKPPDYFAVAWRREKGAGPVLLNLIHVIDDLRDLMGEITSVQAVQSNAVRGFAVEDTAVALLGFANGALGTVSLSDTIAAPWSWEMTAAEAKVFPPTGEPCYWIGGTTGSLTVPRLDHWHYAETQSWVAPIANSRRILPEQDPLVLQLQHFCEVAQGRARPVIDAREGTRTLAATLALTQSAESGDTIRL
jgi:predicted dehydrogenase